MHSFEIKRNQKALIEMQRGKIEKLKGIVDVADATPRLLKDAVRPSFEKNEDLAPNSYRVSQKSDKGTLDR